MEETHFSCFLACFWAVPLNTKNGEEGHPPPFFSFFGRIQKRCPSAPKVVKRDTGAFFAVFVAVSLNFKSGVTLHQK